MKMFETELSIELPWNVFQKVQLMITQVNIGLGK